MTTLACVDGVVPSDTCKCGTDLDAKKGQTCDTTNNAAINICAVKSVNYEFDTCKCGGLATTAKTVMYGQACMGEIGHEVVGSAPCLDTAVTSACFCGAQGSVIAGTDKTAC